MRLEQRIGRIDRIGQEKPVVGIVHLFYRDTVEYDAYAAMEERIANSRRTWGPCSRSCQLTSKASSERA